MKNIYIKKEQLEKIEDAVIIIETTEVIPEKTEFKQVSYTKDFIVSQIASLNEHIAKLQGQIAEWQGMLETAQPLLEAVVLKTPEVVEEIIEPIIPTEATTTVAEEGI